MGAHPRKLLRESYVQEKRAAFPYDDDLPLNSFTPADHHAAHEWTPIKRQNDRKKNKEGGGGDLGCKRYFFPTRGEGGRGGGEKKREKYRLRLAYTLLWSEETLHHAARFFLRLTLAVGGAANVS